MDIPELDPFILPLITLIMYALTMEGLTLFIGILKNMGIQAYNLGLGPDSHMEVLKSSSIDKNALIVDIYGGADARLIKEMGSSWYKNLKAQKKFS
jgi:hypothetical protein